MSENTHSVAIGAFIVGALLIVISTVVFILGSGLGSARETVVMVFDGSVKGLSVGAPVALRGVQIGQVTDINLILDPQSESESVIMQVEAQLDDNNIQLRNGGTAQSEMVEDMIGNGLRAQLNTQSLLTGLLYIQLDFHPQSPINLAAVDSPHLQIPTIPTELQKLSRQIESVDFEQVASDLQSIATGVKSLITDDAFQSLPTDMQNALASVTALSEDLRQNLAVSGPQLERVLSGANEGIDAFNAQVPELVEIVEQNLLSLERSMLAFEETMTGAQSLLAEDSPTTYELNQALKELAQAGRALRQLARSLEQQPEALLRGRSEE